MDLIDAIFESLREQGVSLPQTAAKRAEIDARRQFGGERVYLKGLPKQRRADELSRAMRAFGTSAPTLKRVAQASGIPIRTVKRIVSGR